MIRKLIFFSLVLAIVSWGCKTIQKTDPSTPIVGMFKVTVLYPDGEKKTFDMDYYEKKHMPMVAGMLGKNLKFYEIDRGVAGRSPGEKPLFLAVGYFYIHDVAEYNKTVAQNRDVIISDFKNYTNILPVVLISEIKQVVHNTVIKE